MFQSFAKEPLCWPPHMLSRIPIPQLVALYMWDQAHGIQVVSKAEAIEFLKQREAADASSS